MESLYFAVCSKSNTVKVFSKFEDLKEFAIKERYTYDYYELKGVEKIYDGELFYYD